MTQLARFEVPVRLGVEWRASGSFEGHPMDLMLLRVFQGQCLLQCRFAVNAAGQVNQGLEERNVQRVFFGIQGLLTAAANLSKAFWGANNRPNAAADRKPLRDSVGVSDTSPLRDVGMRNAFDHFDERIDEWWHKSTKHNYIDLNIGPDGLAAGYQGENFDLFRNFDPRTTELWFWGQKFRLQSLIDEVRVLLPKLEAEAGKPHWPTTP